VPDEGFWVSVVVFDEVVDGGFQFFGGAVDAAPELTFGEQREPSLDQVEPRSRSGSEVHMEARAFGQPVLNQLRFMGAIIVQDEVNIQLVRHILLDSVEEVAELFGAMPLLVLADDLSALP
jgi:hypothetical protein